MSTTVRIDESDKDRLRRLQQRFEKVHGRVPTHQELLGMALAFVERNETSFIEEADWRPFTREEIRARAKRIQGNYGKWSAADIDTILYGGDRP
ncbi:MAG TPA: hypothetical protein VI997_12285 [Candidatus Thermoplasmatota archaeon]|nr:hypothetical protein [Candidatus Thermoplasmatota archaeon]